MPTKPDSNHPALQALTDSKACKIMHINTLKKQHEAAQNKANELLDEITRVTHQVQQIDESIGIIVNSEMNI